MRKYPPPRVSRDRRTLRVGDRVQLIRMPRLKALPHESRPVFRRSLGRVFRIASFERYGHAELYVARWETIYVEPEFLRFVRRGPRGRRQLLEWRRRAV